KEINWDGLKDIKQAPQVLKEIGSFQKDVKTNLNTYENAIKRVESEINYLNKAKQKAQELVDQDIKALENKMSLPNLDQTKIAEVLFGPEFVASLQKYQGYFEKAKKYMPPKKDQKEVTVVKKPRGIGQDYQFGTPKSYPLFWLKETTISSMNDQGEVRGKIQDIASDQLIVGRPTRFNINGDFPIKGIRQVEVQGVFDHRQMINDSVKISIGSYPAKPINLSQSESVRFSLEKANARLMAKASLVQDKLSLTATNAYEETQFLVESNQKLTKEIFDE